VTVEPTPRRAPAPERLGGLRLDVLPAKIRPPSLRPGTIARTGLVNGLRRDAPRVVTVVAPAGYGKTTMLVQWAATEARPVAWLSLDRYDDDPLTLLRHVGAAVDGLAPLEPGVLRALAGDHPSSFHDCAGEILAQIRQPFLFVVDNFDRAHSRDARSVLATVIARAPAGSTVALASRTPPKLRPAALQGAPVRLVDRHELALKQADAARLLGAEHDGLSERDVAQVTDVCEGWPAGLYLSSLAIRDGGLRRGAGCAGSDRYLTDYIRSECLSQLTLAQRRFLRRTSILEVLTRPVCNAVLQVGNSGGALKSLARAGLVVVPVEGSVGAYRVPRLLRDVLERELLAEEPALIKALHRRAADWYEARGSLERVLDHARRGGDAERVAATLVASAVPLSARGRTAAIERALAAFDSVWPVERYPPVALHGSRIHALAGRTADAERWLELAAAGARRGGREAAALRPRIAVVRALLCGDGPEQMLADAQAALRKLPPSSQWFPSALQVAGIAAFLLGADGDADQLLVRAAAAAHAADLPATEAASLSQLSLLARAGGDADRADELAFQALELATALDDDSTAALALAAGAQASLRRGRWAQARERVSEAEPLVSALPDSIPWLAAGARLALIRSYIGLRDAAAARALLDGTMRLLAVRPRLDVLVAEAGKLSQETASLELEQRPRGALTPAELRLLPLLATHLSFREIAEELRVSRNTVKTQAISIYRKLGVSGRSEAIAAAGVTGGSG